MALSEAMRKRINQNVEKKTGGTVSSPTASSSTQNATIKSTSSLSSAMLDRIHKNTALKRLGREDTGVDDEFFKKFMNDYQLFTYQSQNDWQKLNYQNSKDSVADNRRKNTVQDLSNRATAIRTYLDINRSSMDDEAYKSISDALDQFDIGRAGIMHNFDAAKSYYSQWETEDDYLKWDAYQTPEGRQARYAENQKLLSTLQEEKKNMVGGGNTLWRLALVSAGAIDADTYLEDDRRLKEINRKIADVENEMRMYERGGTDEAGFYYGSKVVDDYGKRLGDSAFVAAAQNRQFQNADKTALDMYDASQSEGSLALNNGGYFDQDGNIRDSKGYIVQYASAPEVQDKLGLYLSASDEDIAEAYNILTASNGNYQTSWADIMQEGDTKRWRYLKDDELQIYYGLLNTEGQEAAYQYLDAMEIELGRRETEATREMIDSASGWEKVGLNALYVPMNMIGGVASTADNIFRLAQGEDINPYSRAQTLSQTGNYILSSTAQDINEATGGASLPVLGYTLGDVYQAGMSMVASLIGARFGGKAYQAIMSMGAASTEATRLYDQGASMEQIVMGSVSAGAAEYVFEKYSIENLINLKSPETGFQLVKNALIQGGIELSEEAATELANIVSNGIIMQGESDWAKALEANNGDYGKAVAEMAIRIANAGLSGFISGTGSGFIQQGIKYGVQQKQNTETGKYISGANSTDALIALAQEMAKTASKGDSKRLTAQSDLLGKDFMTEGGKNRAIGRLYNTVRNVVTEQNISEISAALQEKGFSKKDATAIAGAIAVQTNGMDLTDMQQKTLDKFKDNADVKNVVNEVLENNESGINQRARSVAKFAFDTMRNSVISQIEQKLHEQENKTSEGNLSTEENVNSYEVSEDGKTHLISDPSKEVNVKGIASIKDGKIMLSLEDGSIVDVDDVSFGSEGEALVYATVGQMSVSVKAANILVNGYKSQNNEMSAEEYAHGIADAFRYGKLGIPERELSSSSFASKLSVAQREFVYRQGKKATGKQKYMEQAAVNKAYNEAVDTGKEMSGGYHAVLEDGITALSLNESQKASYKLADQIAEAAKVNIHVYVGKTGERGYYKPSTDEIWLNLNATNKSRKSMMAFAMGHELVHRAKKGSPAKYQAFSAFLMNEYGKSGASVEEMIAEELQAAKDHEIDMTEEQAFEEVVCNACQRMLLDTDAGKKLAEFGTQSRENKSFLEDLKRWISEFLDKLRSIFQDVEPDSLAAKEFAKFDATAKQILADMYVDMTIDAGDKLSTIQNAFGKGTIVETNEQGEFTMARSADGSKVVNNLTTWNNGGRETLEATLLREGYTEDEVKAALTIMDEKQRLVEKIANEVDGGKMVFPEQGRINEATLTTDLKDGHAVLSALVSNGDYPVNIDLLMVCKKRKAYQRVINRLCETGMIQQATVDSLAIAEINKILCKYGFETACLGCFVESRRLRIQEWAQTICKEWNAEVKKRNPNAKPFGFGKGEAKLTPDEVMQLIGELESGGEKNDQGNLNLGQGSAVKRMGVLLDKVPTLRRTLSIEDLITPDGLSSLRKFDSNLFSMVKSRYGSNSPKFVQEFNPYNHELAKYGKVPTEYKSLREYLYAIGGARMQSFSDFIIENWFDYCQIVADLAARKLPMHTYTKEIALARLFGLTGIKINMSLIPDVDRSLPREYAGLTRNAKGELELIWADKDRFKATGGKSYMQSINFADAVALQNDPRYSANVGTIAVGISDMHIRTMLNDPRIRMVIPYHSSGMNPIFADLMGTSYYKDYTNFQNTTVKQMYDSKGKPVKVELDKTQTGKLTSGFKFNEVLQDLGDARAAAEAYKAWCADASKHTITIKGETYTAELTPKFNDFSGEENYYKLLEDFNTYDCITEEAAPQRDVQQVYPEGFEDILIAELSAQEGHRQKQEANKAFDKAMDEIEGYLKNHTKADTVHYANQHGIKLGAKDKKLSAEDKARLKQLQKEGVSFMLPKTQNTPYRKPAYDEWDVSYALDDVLDHADQHHDNLILVGEMPHFVSDMLGIEGEFYIYRNHAYENMVSEKQALKDNRPTMRKKKKIHFHDLGKQRMQDAILALENPIIAIADSTEKENPKIVMILPVKGNNDAPLYAAMSFYDDQPINGSFTKKPHLVLTVAERGIESADGHDGYIEVVKEAIGDGRILSLDKEKMRAYMPVIADRTRVGNIANSALTDNVARFRDEIKRFKLKNKIDYNLPVGEDTSPRALLSNAFETIITNPIEKKKLQEYKEKVAMLNEEEQKLSELRAEIKELSVANGKKDTKRINELRFEANSTANRISTLDKMLLRFEAATPLQNILQREKEMVRTRERQRTREAVEEAKTAYRLKAEVKQSEILRDYRETKAALKQQKSDAATFEKEFIRIAKAYEKLDTKTAAKIGKDSKTIADLKAALKEETKKHRADQKTWETEFNRLLREYEASGRNIDRLQEKIERQKQAAKAKVESREKTAMRQKIQNVVGELNQLLLNNDKKRHVPDSLKKAVADALSLVNMDTVGAEERAAKYANLIAKEQAKAEPDQDKIDAYTVTMENILRKGEKMGQRLKDLRDAYDEIQGSDDPDIANAYDPVIAGCLKELAGSIGDTSLRDMSIEQLSDVYDMYRMVLTRVRDANKTFINEKKESISNLASRVIGEVRRVGGEHKYRASILDPVKKFGWNNLKPVYAFEHIGSDTLTEVFKGVRAGEDVWAKDVTEAREYYLDKSRKYGYDKWDFKKKYRFESASGDVFELTLDQILSLYAYSKREQAHEHLRLGGFVFDSNIETYKENKHGKSILKYKVNTADAYQITPDILAGIIGTLSQEQASFVDEMQAYLSTTMGAKGNEITMKMYGVKLFKEKFYFPLKSAKQFMFEQNEVSGEVRIKNSGFTNKVVAKANNPVILSNFMDVWSNHVNDMSMYHAFVLPLEDFNRVFNYNSPKQEGQPPVSVKGTIQNAYDPAAVSYVKNLITDLNGGARTDSTTDIPNKLMGMFKKGAVFASASVVVQQPSAIARAAAIIDTKYFIGPKVDHKRHKALWDEVKQYAPVAIIKEMGYFDTNMGKSTQDFIQGKEYSGISEKAKALVTDSGYRDEVLSKAPALADEIAWCAIWEAVKRETMAKNPGMAANSEAFLKKVGERFTEVIVKTQVYDSVLSRSANMRSKDTGIKMATAFMAEPTTAINMVADALLKGKRNGLEGRRFCRKTIGAVVAAQILNAFLVSWVYAARDDDEEETYAEKYLASFASSVLDGINPATYIPFIKDIVSIVKGYDVERSDMAVISDLWQAWQQLQKDDVSAWKKIEGFAGSVCQIFGLPVKNIMRDVRSVFQVYDTMVNGENTTKAGIKYAVKGAVTGKSTPNKEQLYEARMADDKAHTARVEARYGDTDSANAAVRAAIKDRFMEDEIDEATALKQMILYSGMDASEAHWTMDDWKYRKVKGSDDGYSKYGRFYDAVRTGKDLKAVVKEYTDYGVKPSTLSGQITERFKPDYVNMSVAERKSIEKYLINAYEMCGMEREDAVAKIESWGWEAEGIEGATQDAIQDYTEWCEPVGIPKATYMTFRKFANSTKNDVDENGKTVNYSAVQKIMAYINDLNLTSAQKDALAKSKGWSDKTISKYKLW